MMAGYCRNIWDPGASIWNKDGTICIVLVISTMSNMHGTNIKLKQLLLLLLLLLLA
jgi:hypothetical protein